MSVPEYENATDFCLRLGITRTTYYRLRKSGIGPETVKIGKLRMHRIADIPKWLDALRAHANEATRIVTASTKRVANTVEKAQRVQRGARVVRLNGRSA